MKIFLDFEATQENEIISIGAVAESGAQFYRYVKPEFSKLTPFIKDLTGITENILNENGINLNKAIYELESWLSCLSVYIAPNSDFREFEFYSYGDADIKFLKTSLRNITDFRPYLLICQLIATLKDYSPEVGKYFCGNTKLITAYNYIQKREDKQRHNALEDAKMLAAVVKAVDGAEPLAENPFNSKTNIVNQCIEGFKYPSGKFIIRSTGKKPKIREFNSCEEAINWMINCRYPEVVRKQIRKDRIVAKIMTAIRKKRNI